MVLKDLTTAEQNCGGGCFCRKNGLRKILIVKLARIISKRELYKARQSMTL
jgi:hypothetical protein